MSQLTRLSSLAAALFVSAVLLPSSLKAQQVATTDRDTTVSSANVPMPASGVGVESRPTAGPRAVRAGITLPAVVREPGVASPQSGGGAHVGAGSNVAMMGVGAAGIVVGSMIGGNGGTMIAIGGGVIGLIGLFRYLR
jgi:hypothetical protein